MEEVHQIIFDLPKVEIHAHLHGSVRYSTLRELIEARNMTDSISKFVMDQDDHGLAERPFELFPIVHRLVNSMDIVIRILREMVEDYLAENTIYLEIRSSPRGLEDGSTVKDYIQTVVQHIASLNKLHEGKIIVKLIAGIDRSKNINDGRMIYQYAKEFQYYEGEKIIVGMDFAGNPSGGTFMDFQDLFNEIQASNLFHVTVHTAEIKELSESLNGEVDETNTILSFQPHRLGHFLHMKDEHFDRLLELKEQQKAPLIEICPTTSYYLLGLKSFSDHPHIRKLIKHSYPFSINTDDSGLFSTSLTKEITHMFDAIDDLTIFHLLEMEENSILAAFLGEEEKKSRLELFQKKVLALAQKYPENAEIKRYLDGAEMDMSALYTF